MVRFWMRLARLFGLAVLVAAGVLMALVLKIRAEPEVADPPEVAVGERLFLETRFAQYYFAHSKGNPNAEPLANGGDPVMVSLATPAGVIPGPFAGKSMNCRQCHLVDEAAGTAGGGFRTYADFAVRSPIPERGDGGTTTPRNSPPMINLALNTTAPAELYHFDGEFESLEQLAQGSFTGRNFGWKPSEYTAAVGHIASIIRGDDGKGELAQAFGGSYAEVFAGKSSDPNFVLPKEYQLDVSKATDEQILAAVGKLVAAYVDSLVLARDEQDEFTGSPYDAFLQKNGLPRKPESGESDLAYSRRLAQLVAGLADPQYVAAEDGHFALSEQPFVFGLEELAGLKIFLREPRALRPSSVEVARGGVGNCLACHAAPKYTDFNLHNTGVAQEEYDGVHGEGSFARLAIPGLLTRNRNYDAYLPATPRHPEALGPFRRPALAKQPSYTDLGVWNVYLNSDFAVDPTRIERAMGLNAVPRGARDWVLKQAIGRMKTPGLRDLGDSAPYLHNGSKASIEEVVNFYRTVSAKAREGRIRNADAQVRRVAIGETDVAALAAFLKSLKEDYN